MKSSNSLQLKVDELLVVLEKDIELVDESITRLKDIRGLLIKRDEEMMRNVLESVKSESDIRVRNNMLRERIRRELSGILGCDVKNMTIGVLGNYLKDQQREKLFEKRARLNQLTKNLNKEHVYTKMLLAEYSRLNREFLGSVLYPKERHSAVYDSNGQADRSSEATFMNLKL